MKKLLLRHSLAYKQSKPLPGNEREHLNAVMGAEDVFHLQDKQTAAHLAAANGHKEVLKVLEWGGADTSVSATWNLTRVQTIIDYCHVCDLVPSCRVAMKD